jgi:Family of unknown function (DUF6065)
VTTPIDPVVLPAPRGLRAVRYQQAARPPVLASPEPRAGSLPEASTCVVFRQANALGYWVYPPFDADVTWRGGKKFDVEVSDTLGERLWSAVMDELVGWPSHWWCSKLDGIFQMDPGLLFVTRPNTKLLLMGPMNRPSRTHWVHSGVLDSDWFSVPSAVNLEPYEVGARFELRRDVPVAQLVVLDDRTSRHAASELLEIEDATACLTLWRGYLQDKFRLSTKVTSNEPTPRPRRGAYAQWKRDVEKRAVCPYGKAATVLADMAASDGKRRTP